MVSEQIALELNGSKLETFDYLLPEELIATYPCENRQDARLMVLERACQAISVSAVQQISDYFEKGDLLVVNDTKVFPGRLRGQRKKTGGAVEILLIRPLPTNAQADDTFVYWEAMLKGGKKAWENTRIDLPDRHEVFIVKDLGRGRFLIKMPGDPKNPYAYPTNIGEIPLPPYILKNRKNKQVEAIDQERYQTVYAKNLGAIAAPTAGLHFTESFMENLRLKGVVIAHLTLHVGPGTFEPVRSDNIHEHRMEPEAFHIPEETVDQICYAKKTGHRIFAVGTTVVRCLEAAFANGLTNGEKTGATDLFITPGYTFRMIDALITNFHLPKSTLLMLICAFAGRNFVFQAYQQAISQRFRFYSYGDCMLIL